MSRMDEKVKDGEAIDIASFEREGLYYVVPPEKFAEDSDYCDLRSNSWVWSIGRRLSDGVILASLSEDLYLHPEYDCVWLR